MNSPSSQDTLIEVSYSVMQIGRTGASGTLRGMVVEQMNSVDAILVPTELEAVTMNKYGVEEGRPSAMKNLLLNLAALFVGLIVTTVLELKSVLPTG